MALLSIQNLRVEYRTSAGRMVVIPDFSLDIEPGESVGLVGESGCGKSTLLMAIMRYLGRNGSIPQGRILFEGRDLVALAEPELRRIRGSRIAIVYQEPATALNPSLTIGRQLMEVPLLHGASGRDARAAVVRMLADVHLPDAGSIMRRYPHQTSGGQKQRVVLALALLANPSLLLLDEPTTGLDVTVAAAVLDLVNELRRKYGTALVYVSHNLGVIAQVCDRVGVMYAGELVEDAAVDALFGHAAASLYARADRLASAHRRGQAFGAAGADPRCRAKPGRSAPGLQLRPALQRCRYRAVLQRRDPAASRGGHAFGALQPLRAPGAAGSTVRRRHAARHQQRADPGGT